MTEYKIHRYKFRCALTILSICTDYFQEELLLSEETWEQSIDIFLLQFELNFQFLQSPEVNHQFISFPSGLLYLGFLSLLLTHIISLGPLTCDNNIYVRITIYFTLKFKVNIYHSLKLKLREQNFFFQGEIHSYLIYPMKSFPFSLFFYKL